jgi:uncharacterized protein YbbC (DUF1343 family)
MIRTGLDVLLSEKLDLIRGLRLGVVANPSSVDSELRHIVDLLYGHPDVDLRAVMGPQHGARGETQDNMIEWEDFRDPATGLPVYSLYGETRKPTGRMLEGLDAVIFDIQDVGARYYTFIYTMALAMEACAEQGVKFLVLDRPNPINGVDLEGPVLAPDYRSFVGLYPLPVRHGMTVGELAVYFAGQGGLRYDLEVVPMSGWRREMFFDDTGLPWVMPSPNMPTLDTALVYPGQCLLEGTNVSEGRGTTRPFEISGAPWVDARMLAGRLSEEELPGAVFRPVHYIPTFHKWSGRLIGGVQIHVTDRRQYRPVRTSLSLLEAYREQGGERFEWKAPPYEYEYEKLPFDILIGNGAVRSQIENRVPVDEMEAGWQDALESFCAARAKCLLY